MSDAFISDLIARAGRARRTEIRRLLDEIGLRDEIVLEILSYPNAPAALIEELLGRQDWGGNRKIHRAAARHPKTPLALALRQLKHLTILDLLEIVKDVRLSSVLRKKVEEILVEKVAGQPLGVKLSIARLGRGDVLLRLLEEDRPELTHYCLNNPYMTEGQIIRVIFRKRIPAQTIRTIASHRKWRRRYNVKLALLRNDHTPLQDAVAMLGELRLNDLSDALEDRRIHASVRIHIRNEVDERMGDRPKVESEIPQDGENEPME